MKALSNNSRIKCYSGLQAIPIRLKFRLGLVKYLFQKTKYPLFVLNPLKGGVIKTLSIVRKLQLRKIVKFNNHYYFSLTTPRWPSKPFDNMVAHGGLNLKAAGTKLKSQIDLAILAITRKCAFRCKHCFEHFNLGEEDIISIERWKDVIRDIQEIGVNIIALSGGEPLLRFEELLELLEAGNKNLSEFHLYTSGHLLTFDKARKLKRAGLSAVAVGLDDVDPARQDSFRGSKGAFDEAISAIRHSQESGLFTYINLCLTKELIQSGDLMKYYKMAKDIKVGAIRLLEPKPCGGYVAKNPEHLISEAERECVTEFFKASNKKRKFKDYPLITYENYVESPGLLGCIMGGLGHFHIDSLGNVEPCVFLHISFGNILEEDFPAIFARMRRMIPIPLHKQCPSIYLSEKIKNLHENGNALPVPFEKIQKEWAELF